MFLIVILSEDLSHGNSLFLLDGFTLNITNLPLQRLDFGFTSSNAQLIYTSVSLSVLGINKSIEKLKGC